MKNPSPVTIFLKDYRKPDFLIKQVDLFFDLHDEYTEVRAILALRRSPDGEKLNSLVLDGEGLELCSLAIDDIELDPDRYQIENQALIINDVPDRFILESKVRIYPDKNTALEGLYLSSGNYCTQCEAQGFRKITYFLDRPDVMTVFSTTIEADAQKFPYLLSNGNDVARGQRSNGRHWVRWEDPHRKPSYLFALVAGDFALNEAKFTTASGRDVSLRIYTEQHNADKTEHAMRSLERAMRWDEERFGLEYDLDIYMIVAVDDFNMGAMENKGLNVFNSKFVLARPDTATDQDYINIEAVIAHEYFHNWTGNRVTCRDWFQLSLKEGLTVYRDQCFTADMTSAAVKRIDDVRALRTHQFAEDASPMAHPIRPASYMEINNFYTLTVYEKGAEVVRMYETLLGHEGFRKGMDLYFARHDGQAVTTEDFRDAMADANGIDLSQFQRWYEQAGTPVVESEDHWDDQTNTWTLTLRQSCPVTPESTKKAPFLIPIKLALFSATGVPLDYAQVERESSLGDILLFTEAEQKFTFTGLEEAPVPSLLRGFSAPVKLRFDYQPDELIMLAKHDTDPFNRWNVVQAIYQEAVFNLIEAEQSEAGDPTGIPAVLTAVGSLLERGDDDRSLVAEALTLPAEAYLAELMEVIDVEAIHQAREQLKRQITDQYYDRLSEIYVHNNQAGEYALDNESLGRRRLKNVVLGYLMASGREQASELAYAQFSNSDNMTDVMSALQLLTHYPCDQREAALEQFYKRWQDDALVLDKWFATQAASPLPGAMDVVKGLLEHPKFSFKTPNRVRAVIGSFVQMNPVHFHRADGEGYGFAADQIIKLDAMNPQIASRLSKVFTRWRRYDAARQALMKTEIERIAERPGLSPDVFEVMSSSLKGA